MRKNSLIEKNAFVDFDGTIVDVMERYHGILQSYLLSTKSAPLIDFENYINLKRERLKDHEIVKRLCNLDINIADYKRIKRDKLEQIEWLKKDKLIGDPKKAYTILRRKNFNVILLTQRRSKENLLKQIRQLNIADCFDEIIVVNPDMISNPKMAYLKNHYGDEDIIIGDGDAELFCAEQLHIKGYFVKTGLFNTCKYSSVISMYRDYNSVVSNL